MISDFWKFPKELVKKHVVHLTKDITINRVCELYVQNEDLLPKWTAKKSKIFVSGCHRRKGVSDCFIDAGGKTQFLTISDKIYVNNFDDIVDSILYERYFEKKRQIFTRLPIPYHKVPVWIRNLLYKTFLSFREDLGYPNWPIEYSVDLIRHLYYNALKIKLDRAVPFVPFWPKKRCAVTISHDIETSSGFRKMESIREIERTFEVKSCWNVVAKRYKIDFKKLKKLGQEGCEIGSHGYNHDGTLPYLDETEIKKRIEFCLSALSSFNVKGFRSPQLQRTEHFIELLSKYFLYDSSVPDTELHSPIAVRNGCCSVFPFFVNSMIELPLTMPQDFYLIHILGMDKNTILNIWKRKIDFIENIGGLIFLNMHPDSYISGNEEGLQMYEEVLRYLRKKDNKWYALPREIAKWWRKRNSLHPSSQSARA